ncbi:ankyrin repeat domain-containing protein [Candidatus Babeliales bacterium]|nr:ankyrin repeat domain-containing protein [Candidatus Babeliales bacterium]
MTIRKLINSLFTLIFLVNQNFIIAKPNHNILKNGYAPLHNVIFASDVEFFVNNHLESVRAEAEKMAPIQIKKIESLLSEGALVDFPDSYGRTALWWAAERNLSKVMEALIKAGADIENNGSGCTSLSIAACGGNAKAVKVLLDNDANPNCKSSEDGFTPLHDAACGEMWIYPSKEPEYHKCYQERLQDYRDVIKLLIEHGASNDIKNSAGQIPSKLAYDQQHEFYPELKEYPLVKCIEEEIVRQKKSENK